MYGESSSSSRDDDDFVRNNNADRLKSLAKARRNDMQEEYEQDAHNYTSKRKLEIGDTSPEHDYEDDKGAFMQPPAKKSAAEKMMAKMGYREGEGLGKAGQGIVDPIGFSSQRGRHGLGHESGLVMKRDMSLDWDESQEEKTVEETVEWFPQADDEDRGQAREEVDGWMVLGSKKMTIEDETQFCSKNTLEEMLKSKEVFDCLSERELNEARQRANPYETIGNAFFQNRAAMKTANLDRIFDWIFCGENEKRILTKNPLDPKQTGTNVDRDKPLFYFADVCAGPGGFSEYMLWRKGFYNAKGFGFTLAGKDDFKLGKFCASSKYYFEPFYGVHNNGDVMDPENVDSLEEFIMKGTNGMGVDLMMADGGFSVEGNENIQEILSKRLYLCQLLVSLCIVKEGGNFFCKLFDIFTPFSVGLIYLMYMCYDQICLHKPHTSRPANSERYIICKGLKKEFSDSIRNYLKKVNRTLDDLKKDNSDKDVNELIPLEHIKNDEAFCSRITQHNERLARRQTVYLQKYAAFAKNHNLYDSKQGDLREKCMEYWKVPMKSRKKDTDPRSVAEAKNMHSVLGTYSTKIMGDNDWRVKPHLFTAELLANPSDKHLIHAEYRFSFLTKQTATGPQLLIATADNVYIYRGDVQIVDKELYRIPANTILLVEDAVDCFSNNGDNLTRIQHPKLVRIVDAAVLNGDDVSRLSYENRMKAAHKFCDALKLVNGELKTGFREENEQQRQKQRRYNNNARNRTGPTTVHPHRLVCAEYFKLEDFDRIREQLTRRKIDRENVMMITEHDCQIRIGGVRFTRSLPEYLYMGYSRSNKMNYGYSPKDSKFGSIFEHDLEKSGKVATFWDVALLTKHEKESTTRPVMQALWSWQNSYYDDYGPAAIVDAEQHKSGPTIQSIVKQMQANDVHCGRAVKVEVE